MATNDRRLKATWTTLSKEELDKDFEHFPEFYRDCLIAVGLSEFLEPILGEKATLEIIEKYVIKREDKDVRTNDLVKGEY